MAPITARLLLAAFAAVALAASISAAEPGPIVLRARPPLAKTIAAFPRVIGGTNKAATARINEALAGADGAGCSGATGYWDRTIAVTMRGPGYLSLVARDDYYCGTAYPDTDTIPLVFDVATGAPIDWKALFPAEIVSASGTGPGSPDSEPVTVDSDRLWRLYAKTAAAVLSDKQCTDALNNPPWHGTRLMLWPDAEADGVAMMAADFPHVVKACGPPVTLAMPRLKKLGMRPAFLADVARAHRNGWFDRTKR
jgi:hypothetical protein